MSGKAVLLICCKQCKRHLPEDVFPMRTYKPRNGEVSSMNKRRVVCEDCARRQAQSNNYLSTSAGMEPPRKCHDCGRPTRNHRCSLCLEKWQKKHGVSPTARYDSDNNMASTLHSVSRPSR